MDNPTAHGPIWLWSYLEMVLFGLRPKMPKLISPSGHTQIHPDSPFDTPSRGYGGLSAYFSCQNTVEAEKPD